MEADRERGRVLRRKQGLAYEGTILKVYRDLVIVNDREESWDFIHHDDVAAMVPMLPNGGILMMRQCRNALDRLTLKLPAGEVDSPEEPRIPCAFHELSEETGMQAESPETLEPLLRTDAIVTFCDEETDIFVAQNLLPKEQYLGPDEVIDVQTYEPSELLTRVEYSGIRDAKTVAGFTVYALKQSRSSKT